MATKHAFKVNATGTDRSAILEEAAARVDAALTGHLGQGVAGGESEQGKLTRALMADDARLPAFPDVYRITDKDFIAKGAPLPVKFKDLASDYNFYWVRFPVGLRPQLNWAFNMIEVRVEFNEGGPPHLRPKAYQILPQKQFQTLAKANTSLEVTLNSKFEFEAKSGKVKLEVGPAGAKGEVDVGSVAKAGAGAVLGPFSYHVKKAKIDHSATGLEWVFWRIDGAQFFHEDQPELVVILQVPKKTKQVKIKAELQASRHFNLLAAPWQKAIGEIPAILQRFFKDGMPLRDEKPWDITPRL